MSEGPSSDGVVIRDEEWRPGTLARIYTPPADAARRGGAAMVNVHGGAWAMGDRTQCDRYCTAVAAGGFTVVAPDFRDGRQGRHPIAVDDVADAYRWTVAEASRLGIDAARVAIAGSSSGGHLALHTALTHVAVPFVAAFWPPVDPLTRYRYALGERGKPVPEGQAFDAVRLAASSEAYYGDEATMADASIAQLVRNGRAAHGLPPVWVVRGGADLNVPSGILDDLVATYRGAGGSIELSDYPGQVHGFGHGGHAEARRFQAELVERLAVALAG